WCLLLVLEDMATRCWYPCKNRETGYGAAVTHLLVRGLREVVEAPRDEARSRPALLQQPDAVAGFQPADAGHRAFDINQPSLEFGDPLRSNGETQLEVLAAA